MLIFPSDVLSEIESRNNGMFELLLKQPINEKQNNQKLYATFLLKICLLVLNCWIFKR